jgi:competence protein ComEC
MGTAHFLNVGKGDCTLIQHNTGRNTLIDICKGNYRPPEKSALEMFMEMYEEPHSIPGDFGMSKNPTNPITYLQNLRIESLFRFVLTHPDMDHLDGFNALLNAFSIANFWDSGVQRERPDFAGKRAGYNEEDWNRYIRVRNGAEPGITRIAHLAGSRFPYANQKENREAGGDGLYILAPDSNLVAAANASGDINDSSYVLLYRSGGGRILIPGDAHDETWDYVIANYKSDIENCSVLFAPHHGRKSARDFSFLNTVKPKITFFGCAESGHLAYNAWHSRGLPVITNNQAGNIVLECGDGRIHIYVENEAFADSRECDPSITNAQGYRYLDTIAAEAEAQ